MTIGGLGETTPLPEVVRPSLIVLSGDGSAVLQDLRWVPV
jgi:hypothetical protein